MLQLTGPQQQALSEALRAAFTRQELERLLAFALDRRLDDLTSGGTYEEVAFELIQAAQRQGWLTALIDAARGERPGNPQLGAFVPPPTTAPPPPEQAPASAPTIFLSYAPPDEDAVAGLYQRLQAAGFRPWMAGQDILPGETVRTATERALRQADFVLVCLSPDSVDRRGALQREMRQALDLREEMLPGDIYVIPLRLRPCTMPDSLREVLPVDLYEPSGFDRLLRALRAGFQQRAPEPAPRPIPALRSNDYTQSALDRLATAWLAGRLAVIWGATPFALAPERENPALVANRWDQDAAALPAIDVDLTRLPVCPILSLDPTDRVLALFRDRETRISIVNRPQLIVRPGEHGLYTLGGELTTRTWLAMTPKAVREAPQDDDKRTWVLDKWLLAARSGVTLLLGADPAHPTFRAWWDEVLGPRLGGQVVVALGDPAANWPAGIQVAASSLGELLAAMPAPPPRPAPPVQSQPFVGWDDTLTALRDVLAALFPTDDDARRKADEAGVPTGGVKFTGEATATWHSLLKEAHKRGEVSALLAAAQAEYPRRKDLAEAAAAYLKQHPDG